MDLIDLAQKCVGKRFIILKSNDAGPPLDGDYFPGARSLGATSDGGSQWQYRADRLLEIIRRTPIEQKNLRLKTF